MYEIIQTEIFIIKENDIEFYPHQEVYYFLIETYNM